MPEPSEAGLSLPHPILEATRGPRRLRDLFHVLMRPEGWMASAALAAWLWMWTAMPDHAHPGHHGGGPSGLAARMLPAAVMVVAMMLPLAIVPARRVARTGAEVRRHPASAAFLAVYLALWMIAMGLIDAAWRAGAAADGWTAAMAVTILAAVWEITPIKRRLLEACDAEPSIAPAGGRAYAHVVAHGIRETVRCVGSCWALMAACVAFAHNVPVMVGLFAVQVVGRYWPGLPPLVRALAVAGVCLAALGPASATHHRM